MPRIVRFIIGLLLSSSLAVAPVLLTQALAQQRAQHCGNGKVDFAVEQCDDGNTTNGDGCSERCMVESGWKCPKRGGRCKQAKTKGDKKSQPQQVCGNGKVESGLRQEACDDGNVQPGDGCSPICQVDSGWMCGKAGKPCTLLKQPTCGNGVVEPGEQCDDGNKAYYDGCSGFCKQELHWSCGGSPSQCHR